MSARHYLAWNMLVKVAYEDERREQGKFQADMRNLVLKNPLQHISENNFIRNIGSVKKLLRICAICLCPIRI